MRDRHSPRPMIAVAALVWLGACIEVPPLPELPADTTVVADTAEVGAGDTAGGDMVDVPHDALPDQAPDAEVDAATPDADGETDAPTDADADVACGPPSLEICNGVDDNCDGQTDEGFDVGAPCDGPDEDACENGQRECTENGLSTVCGAEPPADNSEVCDSIDNDCDGETDEIYEAGDPCDGMDFDFCKNGLFECTADGLGVSCYEPAEGGISEECGAASPVHPSGLGWGNAVDEDCDGMFDEECGLDCAGYCQAIDNVCTGANSQYASTNDCEEYCASWAKIPAGQWSNDKSLFSSTNTLACRVYHLEVAIEEPGTTEGIHCPHSGPSGGGTCGTWCENYCHLTQINCTGVNELYPTHAACETACSTFPETGTVGDAAGDSVQCRLNYAALAGSDPSGAAGLNCPAAAADGGTVCVD